MLTNMVKDHPAGVSDGRSDGYQTDFDPEGNELKQDCRTGNGPRRN
jgi:hypothetical protein